MSLWSIFFETKRPLATLPRLQVIASERRADTSYWHEGRFRQAEPQCVFQYTLKGEGVFRDQHGEHRLPAGTGFLCKISDTRVAYGYPAGHAEPWEFVFISMLGTATDRMVEEIVARYGALHTLPLTHPLVRQWLALGATGTPHVQVLNAASSARGVMELLLQLMTLREESVSDPDAGALVKAVKSLIAIRLEEPVNVKALAVQLRVSREHLSRVFREQTGQTLHDYLIHRKVAHACVLLKETRLSLKEISQQLAFVSQAHFTRTFRRVMRMTPSLFRNVGAVPFEWSFT